MAKTMSFRQRYNAPRVKGKIQVRKGYRTPKGMKKTASSGGGGDHG